MATPRDPLAQLRDIHLPDPVGYWPPAPGWWLLLLLGLLAITYGLYRVLRQRRRNRYRRLALAELRGLAGGDDNPGHYLQALNAVLKRAALAAPDAPPVAGLYGARWLQFLDQTGNTRAFADGAGRLLLDGPYRPGPPGGPDKQRLVELRELAEHWVKHHRMAGAVPC